MGEPGPSFEPSAKDALEVERIARREDLASLVPAWSALCDACPWATPFQRPEWLIPFCRHLGPAQLFGYVLRRKGAEPVSLAPFVRAGEPHGRELILAGAGISDYSDVIVDPAHAVAAYTALFRALRKDAGSWDRFELSALPMGSPSRTFAPGPGFQTSIEQGEPCPVLRTSRPLSEVVPSRQLARYRKYRARAHRAGRLKLELVGDGDAVAGFRAFERLHTACWRARGAAGMLADGRVIAFHEEVVTRMAAAGRLRLYFLRLDGRPIAGIYGFWDKGTTYCYLQGYDPDFDHLSPGMLALGHLLEAEQARGTEKVDFLRGREPYKYAWGAVDEFPARRSFRFVPTGPGPAG